MATERPEPEMPSGSPSDSYWASIRSEIHTNQEAAKVLGVTDRRVRVLAQEGRLELTERTESTLRDQLQREQERADQAELEARKLRAALEVARKPERPWWRRVFGG